MKIRSRILTSASAILLALLPQNLAAATWIYCGGLPKCGGLVDSYVGNVLTMLLAQLPAFVYILGGLFILIGGMYIVLSGANSENLTKGKNTIIWAAIGIFAMEVIVSIDPLSMFLKPEIAPLAGVSGIAILPSAIGVAMTTVQDLLYVALLGVAIFSGMRMVTSGGKDDQYNKGKEGLFWAAVGAIIINVAGFLRDAFTNI